MCPLDAPVNVPMNPFTYLLVWRAKLPHETCTIEGMNSLLQEIARTPPSIGIGLAADRLTIKCGDIMTPENCCGWHGQVIDAHTIAEDDSRVSSSDSHSSVNVPTDDERAHGLACTHTARPRLLPRRRTLPSGPAACSRRCVTGSRRTSWARRSARGTSCSVCSRRHGGGICDSNWTCIQCKYIYV